MSTEEKVISTLDIRFVYTTNTQHKFLTVTQDKGKGPSEEEMDETVDEAELAAALAEDDSSSSTATMEVDPDENVPLDSPIKSERARIKELKKARVKALEDMRVQQNKAIAQAGVRNYRSETQL